MTTDKQAPSNEGLEPVRLDLRSHDITADKREELLRLFPEVRTEDGRIDFDQLQRALGDMVDGGRERYGMVWPGKADCFKAIQQPSLGTLLPDRNESVDFDTTENLIIEGDNLEVLKLLQKSYLGKVKMIYIDPPYNTGSDFIYPDDYSESLRTYLEYTGQVDSDGRKFSTNADSGGRFHSKWLNMMYPRIYLARNLLRDDGVILVSIDDRELNNLRMVLNEIFGDENFLGLLVWHSKRGGGGDVKTLVAEQEYILAYAKADPSSAVGRQWVKAPPLDLTDEKGPYRKGRELNKWGAGSARADRPTMFFPIPGPEGEEVWPIRNDGSEGRWRLGKQAMMEIVDEGDALFENREDGTYIVYEKIRSDEPRAKAYRTILTSAGSAAEGTATMKELFEGTSPFDFPKPVSLLRVLLELSGVSDDDIVFDFFAGSGTTAHAVIELNKEDGGDRKFILGQLPEPTGRDDYPTIVDICKERVRRVIKTLTDENAGKLPLDDDRKQDCGFRVFKLAESNFLSWNAAVPQGDVAALEKQLELHVDHTREGRTSEDQLYEILLKSGIPLTTSVEKLKIEGKSALSIGEGEMMVCLDADLTLKSIRAMAACKPARVVCLDEGFAGNDQLKANAVQLMKDRDIVFRTV